MTEDQELSAKYQQITDANIAWRGEGFDDIGDHLSRELYSERTHFIYELLQNAEDALALRKLNTPDSNATTTVHFHLFPDRLEVRHFGQSFNDNDIRSISDVFESTKANDPSMIGKKGIGFKSVYAFTAFPEVHSGRERFQIHRYIRLKLVDRRELTPDETLFVLPFADDAETRQQAFIQIRTRQEAFIQIRKGLENLDLRPLLFLRHVSEINWTVEGQAKGFYLHESRDEGCGRRVTLISEGPKQQEVNEEWLVFQRPVEEIANRQPSTVEIAFRLSTSAEGEAPDIVPVQDSRLLVYFPTKLETHVGFLMQGPYRTTANREGIHDPDDWNQRLVIQTAELVVESLRLLRDQHKLTVAVLSAMPLDVSKFPKNSIFRPLYDKVREALREEPLLPTNDKSYVAGRFAKVARGEELLELLSPIQLRWLLGASSPLLAEQLTFNWLDPQVTDARTPLLHQYLVGKKKSRWYLNDEVKPLVDNLEVRPETVLRLMSRDFFEQQSDDWLVKFCRFMLPQTKLWEDVKDKFFIRLEDASAHEKPIHVAPFRREGQAQIPNVYLPTDTESDFQLVKRSIVADSSARDFLTKIGLTEPNLVAEVLQKVLPKYSSATFTVTDEDHRRDLEKIVDALRTDSGNERAQLVARLKDVPFLRASNAGTAETTFSRPGVLYVHSPELLLYFQGNAQVWFFDEPSPFPPEIEQLLGIATTVRISRLEPDNYGHVKLEKSHSSHKQGLNHFDPSLTIDGLQHGLTIEPKLEKSIFIWNQLIVPNAHCLHGMVESSTRQTFVDSSQEKLYSEVGRMVRESSWLPNQKGEFSLPQNISLDELPAEFQRHEGVAQALGMKSSSLAALARETGVSPQILEYLVAHPDEAKELFEESMRGQSERKPKPKPPEAEPRDPAQREERVTEQARNAAPVDRQIRERRVRKNWDTKEEARTTLRELNTNEDGQMVCQICRYEMPFKLDDDSYHFEAVECVKGLNRELPQNNIALCPVCAAKFKHAIGTSPTELKQGILETKDSEVQVTLARKQCYILFTRTHLLDLRAALKTL